MKLDSAISKALGVDASNALVQAHGGAGMSSAVTAKITITLQDGSQRLYFMKTGTGKEAEVMFEGEYASLKALHNAIASFCPAALAHGKLADSPGKSFLVTDFLELNSRRSLGSSKSGSLASKLAKLHTTPAPIPDGYSKPMFGFPVTTCCGDTPQDNSYKHSWAEFFADNRLRFIVDQSEKNNGKDKELRDLVERTAQTVVPRLLGDDHLSKGKGVMPVVVHGDLWSGNAGHGIIGSSQGESEDVVFDPSAFYAHNEYDFGIMRMFGRFGAAFFTEYHKTCPKTEPVSEYDDRVTLYTLYHQLNHHALFGGEYRSGAVSSMRSLLQKYGKENL